MATFTYSTPTGNYNGGLPATGREVRDDLDDVRNFVVGKNLEGANIQDDTVALINLTPTVREFLAPTGSIVAYAVETEPDGWLLCDGQVVVILTYPDLYALIGTTYGPDTATTFTLPDFRGRSQVGTNNAGLPNGVEGARDSYDLADTNGDENTSIVSGNIPAHVHSVGAHTHKMFTANTAGGGAIPIQTTDGKVTAALLGAGAQDYQMINDSGGAGITLGDTSTSSGDTGSLGSGTEFDVRNPTSAIAYIIKT